MDMKICDICEKPLNKAEAKKAHHHVFYTVGKKEVMLSVGTHVNKNGADLCVKCLHKVMKEKPDRTE